eukprot:1152016-Pelagomonas_calceolata.AAC.2
MPELAALAGAPAYKYTRCHRHPQLTLPTQKANPLGMNAQSMSAKYQASLKDNNLTDTGFPSASPGGTSFYNIAWLAWAEARPSSSKSSSPIPNLMFLLDLKDALESYMHVKHRLVYADHKTGYYTYY